MRIFNEFICRLTRAFGLSRDFPARGQERQKLGVNCNKRELLHYMFSDEMNRIESFVLKYVEYIK